MRPITVYHNPNCGTSRNVLALLRERGIEPIIIEYLKDPPTRETLTTWLQRSHLGVRDFMRTREKLYTILDLANPNWTEGELLTFLIENPSLLNRPVVDTPKNVRPCRPAQTVLDLLD